MPINRQIYVSNIYTVKYYSVIKKQWNNAICSNMDGPRDYRTKWSQKEKHKYHMISLNMWNIKYDTNEFIHKTETDSHT